MRMMRSSFHAPIEPQFGNPLMVGVSRRLVVFNRWIPGMAAGSLLLAIAPEWNLKCSVTVES